MSDRPTKREFLMAIANLTSQMSTCGRLHVGCVIATEDLTQFVIGYNGGAAGGPNACLRDEPGNCGCIHAEMNAIAKATRGLHVVCFSTDSPCEMCAILLVNAGVKEVNYQKEYRVLDGVNLLIGAGIDVYHMEPTQVLEVQSSVLSPAVDYPTEAWNT